MMAGNHTRGRVRAAVAAVPNTRRTAARRYAPPGEASQRIPPIQRDTKHKRTCVNLAQATSSVRSANTPKHIHLDRLLVLLVQPADGAPLRALAYRGRDERHHHPNSERGDDREGVVECWVAQHCCEVGVGEHA